MTRSLVFGGARSGKSAYAEQLARQAQDAGRTITYVATAQAGDAEMVQRIAAHRSQRPTQWRTVEEPLHLAQIVRQHDRADGLILVDCVTVWLSNLLFADARDYPELGPITPPAIYADQRHALLLVLQQMRGDIVLVSNEVGMGIVPQGAVSRWFVDEAGRLNQALAAACDKVSFIAAGLPLHLKV
jgi:adenosylcobinamide kinase/adenosylcobinamide-phosphate guanylyltransferase